MTHEMIKEKLAEFFDQELSGNERLEMEAHLQTCAECQKAVAPWKRLRAAALKFPRLESSDAFVSQIMEHLEPAGEPVPANASPAWSLPKWLLPALGYMAVFILMVAAIADRFPLISEEEVLRAGLPQGAQWAVTAEPPDASKLLGM